MQILVLGSHRSGTSVYARLLNMMGAYLGAPESIKGPNPENRKGFWENDEVVDINKLVMHTVGCRWDRVVSMNRANFDLIYDTAIGNGVNLHPKLPQDLH